MRWKVQLELAPAEIAMVYRQGLARGAEVCRRGTQEWRPLVTTPELRPALSAGSTLRSLKNSADNSPPLAPTLTQTPQIADPSLAALVLTRRPSSSPPPAVPPPPVVITRGVSPEHYSNLLPAFSADMPLLGPAPVLRPVRSKLANLAWLTRHARPAELTLMAAIAVLLTLTATLLAQRVLPARAAPASRAPWSSAAVSGADPSLVFGPRANIPIVAVHDLPVEPHAALAAASVAQAGSSAPPALVAASAPPSGVDTAALARVMTLASRAAKGCGEGPVNAQVVATFAPSGAVRAVQFGAGAPPVELRSCILGAVARARVKPFQGAAVTVSKTLRW